MGYLMFLALWASTNYVMRFAVLAPYRSNVQKIILTIWSYITKNPAKFLLLHLPIFVTYFALFFSVMGEQFNYKKDTTPILSEIFIGLIGISALCFTLLPAAQARYQNVQETSKRSEFQEVIYVCGVGLLRAAVYIGFAIVLRYGYMNPPTLLNQRALLLLLYSALTNTFSFLFLSAAAGISYFAATFLLITLEENHGLFAEQKKSRP